MTCGVALSVISDIKKQREELWLADSEVALGWVTVVQCNLCFLLHTAIELLAVLMV